MTCIAILGTLCDCYVLAVPEQRLHDALLDLRPSHVNDDVVLIDVGSAGAGPRGVAEETLTRVLHKLAPHRPAAVGIVQTVEARGPGIASREANGDPGVPSQRGQSLSEAILGVENVILPAVFSAVVGGDAESPHGLSASVRANSLQSDQPTWDLKTRLRHLHNPFEPRRLPAVGAADLVPPPDELMEHAVGLGYLATIPDRDGILRRHRLLIEVAGRLVPSFELRLSALWWGTELKDFVLSRLGPEPPGVRLGRHRVPTDSGYGLPIDFSAEPRTFSLEEMENGEESAAALHGRVVLVGSDSAVNMPATNSVRGSAISPLRSAGYTVCSLLAERPLQRPHWGWIPEISVLVFTGLLLAFLTPRVGLGSGALLLAALVAAWVGMATLLFLEQGLYLKVLSPVTLAMAGYPIQVLWRGAVAESSRAENAELNRSLGVTLHGQGMLDLAFERLVRCPLRDEATRSALYNLGLDFERKRLPAKAAQVYRHLARAGRYRDVLARLSQLENVGEKLLTREGAGPKGGTLVLDCTEVQPTLGRYEIVGELGRGAMSTVYRGRDPKINREVAIKAVDFSSLDEQESAQVKGRFLREAEAAGKLNHPNIVTVYDVGEEHDLAYLAMELLGGDDLIVHCQERRLLRLNRALGVVAGVAEALEYAHSEGVVHRDIKPANIRLLDGDQVKVTDFGIARIMNASLTRTGAILGTPYYMSPEQVAGKRVDGRSDLFSLGVVFYELLTGRNPFLGESPAAVMYNIAKSAHVPIREHLPGLPSCCEGVVETLLRKAVSRRFKSAAEVREAVLSCRERIA